MKLQGESERKKGIYYEVDPDSKPIGTGGMGQVYRGYLVEEATGVTRPVAIKFLFDDLPADAIDKSRREANIRLQNDNLVEMLGFIETEGKAILGVRQRHYHVVSELLWGVSLQDVMKGKTKDFEGNEVPFAVQLMREYKQNPLEFAKKIVHTVLMGLIALHNAGYIHRDIDPSNIMVTRDKKIKLIDFGIAKKFRELTASDVSKTKAGVFIGKPQYASPELVLGDIAHQNQTTDIYAMGILLYQCITGREPFEGDMATVLEQQQRKPVPLKLVKNKHLRAIIRKATQKRREDRYQSSAEMMVAIERLPSPLSEDKFSFYQPTVLYSAAASVAVLVGAGLFALSRCGSQPDEQALLAQTRIDSLYQVRNGQVIDSPELDYVIDAETGAQMVPVAKLGNEAFKKLEAVDPFVKEEGANDLKNIIDNYSSYKNAAPVLALAAAIMQPEENSHSTDRICQLRNVTAHDLVHDARRAHELAVIAVQADTTCYQALYELATDYAASEERIGKGVEADYGMAMKVYTQGLMYAEQNGDSEYVKLYKKRIEQLVQFLK